jgi:hypothetical protein
MIYHLFIFDDEARGGIHDFQAAFDTIEIAEMYLKDNSRASNAHIAWFDEMRKKWNIEREYRFSRMDVNHPNSGYLETFNNYRWVARIYNSDQSWYVL